MKHPPWIFLVVLVLTAFVFVAPVCADALNGSPPFGQIVAITAQTSPVAPSTAIESPFMVSYTETFGQPINGDAVKKIAKTDNLAAKIANPDRAIQKAQEGQHDVIFWTQAALTTQPSTWGAKNS